MPPPLIHVIGAGLAGLAAALRVAEVGGRVVVSEAAGQAGGRCRSYHDATLGTTIDNGNHLVLSGNHATLSYLRALGTQGRLTGPPRAEFPFVDRKTMERWCLRPNAGRVPWWILDPARRVPETRLVDYLRLAALTRAPADATFAEVIDSGSRLYERLWHPLMLAALNTDPKEGSARLAAAIVRETLLAGGHACRPLVAQDGLSGAFVEPAVDRLRGRGTTVRFGCRLRAIELGERRVDALDFGDERVTLAASDVVVLAVPPWVATTLVPGLTAPTQYRAIVNAHFLVEPPRSLAPMTGIVNGTAEWLFAFRDRLSVTISGADRLLDVPREALAAEIWQDVAAVTGLAAEAPPWQIIKERRATFAALPQQDAMRPQAATAWTNLILAGDWVSTGLPATIEGAIRSGNRAADLAIQSTNRVA